MLVLGDVMAVIAILIGFALSAWGGMLLAALIFPRRAHHARRRLEEKPAGTFLVGLFVGGPLVLIGVGLLNAPQPVLKFAGFIGLMVVLALGMVGSGGLAMLAGERVLQHGGGDSLFVTLAKGGWLAVFACLMPIFGWFFVAPVMLTACVGAGIAGWLRPLPAPIPQQETVA